MNSDKLLQRHLVKSFSFNKRFWIVISFIINILLMIGFSMTSFFRPYYGSYNSYMDKNSYTISKSYFGVSQEFTISDLISSGEDFYEEEVKTLDEDNIASCQISYYINDINSYSFFYVPTNYNLYNLGYLPIDNNYSLIDDGYAFLITDDSNSNTVDAYKDYLNEFKIKFFEIELSKIEINSLTIPFQFRNEPLIVLSNSRMYDYNFTISNYRVYYTVHTKHALSDQMLSRLSSLSGKSSGFITPKFDSFIHPEENYLRFYPILSSFVTTLLVTTSILACALIVATLFTDYIKLKDVQNKIYVMKLFGMKETQLFYLVSKSRIFNYLISWFICLLVYFCLNLITGLVSNFTFFFAWYFYLIYAIIPLIINLVTFLVINKLYKECN